MLSLEVQVKYKLHYLFSLPGNPHLQETVPKKKKFTKNSKVENNIFSSKILCEK